MATRRILLVCNKFPYPPNDGGAIASLSMIRNLQREGWQVTVLAMNTHKHYVDLDELPQWVKDLASFYAVDVDIRIRPLGALMNLLFSKEPYHIWRFSSKPFREQLTQLFRYQKYDIIQLEGLYLTPYVEDFRRLSPGTPVVLRAHNIEHEIWYRQAEQAKGGLRKRYLQETADRIEAYELRHLLGGTYDAVVPITQRDAREMKAWGVFCPIHVCNAGIDEDLLENKEEVSMEFPSVFYIGALDWTPNQEGLFWFVQKVWPQLTRRYPKLKFYVAGRRMPDKIAELEQTNIKILGEIKNAYTYMRSKAVMVVPLFAGSGMRVKIIEGMALGKAIVATSVAAEGIPVTHGDNILIADTPEKFADCISVLVDSLPMVQAMGEHAREFVRNRFDNRRIGKDLVGFYETLLEEKEA